MSWRDTASETAQTDLDDLLDLCLPFAREQVDQHGELFPFGAVVNSEGIKSLHGADPGAGELPTSSAVRTLLIDVMRSTREGLRAVAVCSDVRGSKGDAIRVELEHAEGPTMAVFLPYKKKRFGNRVEYMALTAGPGNVGVWGS
jgi:hypothetical protein